MFSPVVPWTSKRKSEVRALNIHKYQTRSATKQNFNIPKAKTNNGKFNIRFQGAKTWNAIEESLGKVGNLKKFEYNLKSTVIKLY